MRINPYVSRQWIRFVSRPTGLMQQFFEAVMDQLVRRSKHLPPLSDRTVETLEGRWLNRFSHLHFSGKGNVVRLAHAFTFVSG